MIIRLPLGISEGLSMMMFYLMGHLFKKAQTHYKSFTNSVQHYIDVVGTVIMILLFFCAFGQLNIPRWYAVRDITSIIC